MYYAHRNLQTSIRISVGLFMREGRIGEVGYLTFSHSSTIALFAWRLGEIGLDSTKILAINTRQNNLYKNQTIKILIL